MQAFEGIAYEIVKEDETQNEEGTTKASHPALKDKIMVYSAGLRLAELINLQVYNILPDRMELFIKGGKGKKDRVTILSDGN